MVYHVLTIARNRYEVCSDDGRYSREFPTRKEAEICADALRAGKTDTEAMELVAKHNARKEANRERSRLKSATLRSLGLRRNRDGSWE